MDILKKAGFMLLYGGAGEIREIPALAGMTVVHHRGAAGVAQGHPGAESVL
jgi:hypothetical protein